MQLTTNILADENFRTKVLESKNMQNCTINVQKRILCLLTLVSFKNTHTRYGQKISSIRLNMGVGSLLMLDFINLRSKDSVV